MIVGGPVPDHKPNMHPVSVRDKARSILLIVTAVGMTFGCTQERAHAEVEVDPGSKPTWSISATQLMPLEARSGVYLMTSGKHKGEKVPFTIESQDERWVETMQEWDSHVMQLDEDGNIVIPDESDLKEGLNIEYSRPVVLLPATIGPDTRVSGKTAVTIRDLDDGRVTNEGKCTWSVRFVDRRTVNTPAGEFQTYRLHMVRKISLSLVTIVMDLDFDYAPGKGEVAVDIHQTKHFIGLFTDRDAWSYELAE